MCLTKWNLLQTKLFIIHNINTEDLREVRRIANHISCLKDMKYEHAYNIANINLYTYKAKERYGG